MTAFSLNTDLGLRVGDHCTRLTPIEARAFRYLLDRIGKVVPRENLERDVWGLHADVHSEAVPVAIRVLRRKLGPYSELLETVRSVGWRLHAPSVGAPLEPVVDAASIQRFRDNVDSMVDSLRHADDADVDDLCVYLVHATRLIVPSKLDQVLRAITLRAPNRLVARLLIAPVTHDEQAIREGLAHPAAAVRHLAMDATVDTNPALLKPDWLSALQDELDGTAKLEVAGLRLVVRVNHGDEAAFDELDGLLAEARPNRVAHFRLLWRIGAALWRTGAVGRAAFLLESAIVEGQSLGLDTLGMRRVRALCVVHQLPLNVQPLIDISDELDTAGQSAQAALSRGYAAWMLAGAGRFDEMTDLVHGAVSPPTFRAVVERLRLVVAAYGGDVAAAETLAACDADAFIELGQEPRFSVFLAAWIRLVTAAATGDPTAWGRIADLPGPDGVEVLTLQRLAVERATR